MSEVINEDFIRSTKRRVQSIGEAGEWLIDPYIRKCVQVHDVRERIEKLYRSSEIRVELTPNISIKVPYQFNDLVKSIKESKKLLDLKDNWDDQGSPGYSEETLQQAIRLIVNYSRKIWVEEGIVIDAPKILPAQNGSIDLFWEKDEYTLLINVPRYPGYLAGFYGDFKNDEYIEGKFNLSLYKKSIIFFFTEGRGDIDF